MSTKFYARSIEGVNVEIQSCELGVKLVHNGKAYYLSITNQEEVTLATDYTLNIKPKSGNRIVVQGD